jgi:FG-GAP-like repeat
MTAFSPQFGDWSGTGRLDLVSGSNCCDPNGMHLFLRRADGSFAERAYLHFKERQAIKYASGTSRPYLVDWDRDGHTDLVIVRPGIWTFDVALGPLADTKDRTFYPTTSVELPHVDGAPSPIHFAFADWDGDGRMDLLVAVDWGRAFGGRPGRYSVYWYRNTSDKGPPRFAKASHLLDIPDPWQLHAFATVDWGGDRLPSLVVSVSKGWKLGEHGRGWWPVTSELRLYRRVPGQAH